jgi:hypothetical protein
MNGGRALVRAKKSLAETTRQSYAHEFEAV